MDRTLPAIITGLVVIALFALMWRSWRARKRRDSGLDAGYPAPATDSAPLVSVSCLYVATTPRDRPLERLAIPGLGFRARADIAVTDAGVWLSPRGETPVYIPAEAITLLGPATVAIDRVVEKDGLLRLGWHLVGSATPVNSYFRITDVGDRRRLTAAIRSLSAATITSTTPDHESEA
ncbi:hypothetical protein D6T64_06725 [Cryobacterium melibiosiphilum]|uniref:PH domain-containing protein n=1 Tax=Cryobacterium melibiosiphilum TaxID=995039 RepID=A0A3A5MQR3_9MICO|nr:hypothetical protein [Cryobacterium melibiosiphilum]RJT89508.1 hypothetical protein D6T64_06725 [Cryobacterium melibiosiphilum]